MSETNKDSIRRYQEAYNKNDLDVLDEILDPNWTSNGWPEGIPRTIEDAKQLYQMILQSFPDTHYDTLDLIAEGDKVVQRWKLRATFKGEILGLPPTGEVVEAAGMEHLPHRRRQDRRALGLRRRPGLLASAGRRAARIPGQLPASQLRLANKTRGEADVAHDDSQQD